MTKNTSESVVKSQFAKLQDGFRSHWISVKFYESKPAGLKIQRKTRFCEAVDLALTGPVLVKLSDIPCDGGKHVAQNSAKTKAAMMTNLCTHKGFSKQTAESIIRQISHFPAQYAYAGFNIDGQSPDLAISFMSSEGMTQLITIYNAKTGKKLSNELTGLTSVCGECAAKSLRENIVTISLGCEDARKYAGLGERAVVCIPAGMMGMFAGN